MNERMKDAITAVVGERQRQITDEGWTPENDDGHQCGEIARAAAALLTKDYSRDDWGLVEKHAGDELRSLVIAGALVLAEIERVMRRQGRELFEAHNA